VWPWRLARQRELSRLDGRYGSLAVSTGVVGALPARRVAMPRAWHGSGSAAGSTGVAAGAWPADLTRGHAGGRARQQEHGRLDGRGGGSLAGRLDARPCRRTRRGSGSATGSTGVVAGAWSAGLLRGHGGRRDCGRLARSTGVVEGRGHGDAGTRE
jgi:hypothetical protein